MALELRRHLVVAGLGRDQAMNKTDVGRSTRYFEVIGAATGATSHEKLT
jgi:hypothetical protein